MSDIFISYASEDRAYAKQLAESLAHHGWSIWWDRKIPFGKSFDQVIEEQITEARCLIVLWSAHSVASDWVKNEAREGKERGILIPVLIEEAKIPLEFRHVQTANLVGWEPALPHSEFDELLRELTQLLARQPRQAHEQYIPSASSGAEPKIEETSTSVAPSTLEMDLAAAISRSRGKPEEHVPIESVAGSQPGATEMLGEAAGEHVKEVRQGAKKKPLLTTLLLAMFAVGASLVFVITRWERPVEQREITSAPSPEVDRPIDRKHRAEILYQQGVESEDVVQKVKLFREAAELGHKDAQSGLGGMYFFGYGVAQDYAESLKWHRKAAEQGDAEAQNNTGIMYSEGLGVARNEAEAVKWFRKAAEQGDAEAQNNIAVMYNNGRGVAEDEAEAVKWYRMAAEQGHDHAQAVLGIMYEEGRGVAKDEVEAVKWYRMAAEQGHANSQTALGIMYADGRGVAEDKIEAVKWYRKAAEQGDAAGQFRLGYSYAMGVGIARNLTEAVKWITKAARQDHAQAQWALGLMYVNGRGVSKDEDEAVKWFRKAAAQGDEPAQRELKKRGLDW